VGIFTLVIALSIVLNTVAIVRLGFGVLVLGTATGRWTHLRFDTSRARLHLTIAVHAGLMSILLAVRDRRGSVHLALAIIRRLAGLVLDALRVVWWCGGWRC
jgi:hypothetical protein